MLRTIRLKGIIGKKFGTYYKFDVSSTAEAVRALCHQVKGFREYMFSGDGKEQKFKVVVNKNPLTDYEGSLHMQSEGVIDIVPVISGGGGKFGSVLSVVAGAALIASSFGLGPIGGLFVGEFAAFSSTAGFAVGTGLLLSGASSMLFKPPQLQNPKEKDVQQDRSYLFNGAVNTVQQGQPIPIGYGRLKIGSQVVSVGVQTAQVPI